MLNVTPKRIISLLGLTAVATIGTAATPKESQAQYERVHAVSCQPTNDNGHLNVNTGGAFTVFNSIAQLGCPIADSFDLPKADIEAIEVYTHDGTSAGNNYTRVYACGVDRDSFDAACLQGQTAGGSGFKTLVLSTAQELGWLQSVHREEYYASMHVYMRSDAPYAGTAQQFMGYTVHD